MDRGVWRAIVHGGTKRHNWSDLAPTHTVRNALQGALSYFLLSPSTLHPQHTHTHTHTVSGKRPELHRQIFSRAPGKVEDITGLECLVSKGEVQRRRWGKGRECDQQRTLGWRVSVSTQRQELNDGGCDLDRYIYLLGPQVAPVVKNSPANAGDIRDAGSIPGLQGSPGTGHGNTFQYSHLENPMDRGA